MTEGIVSGPSGASPAASKLACGWKLPAKAVPVTLARSQSMFFLVTRSPRPERRHGVHESECGFRIIRPAIAKSKSLNERGFLPMKKFFLAAAATALLGASAAFAQV